MISITLLFYEKPGALNELLHWEDKNKGKFTKEDANENGMIIYTLIDKDEKIFCYPLNKFSINRIDSIFCQSYTYNKTLIFGKINHFQLEKIQQILLKYE